MHRLIRRTLPALGLLLLGTSAQAQYTIYGVTNVNGQQQLVRFSSATPGTVTTVGATGANLIGIDFRPATGELYGTNGSSVFTVNTSTGAASSVAALTNSVGGGAVTTGNVVGFDFNPTVDRIRVVDLSGTNLRVNPATGVAIVDGAYSYAAGDVSTGFTPSFSAVGYTNSFAGAATTQLFGIDAGRGTLVAITSPNGGSVSTVGSLGLGAFSTISGFDIVTVGGVSTAFLSVLGAGAPVSTLYTVNLASGLATSVGAINASGGVAGIAVATVPEPGSLVLLASGLVAVGGAVARRRRRAVA